MRFAHNSIQPTEDEIGRGMDKRLRRSRAEARVADIVGIREG